MKKFKKILSIMLTLAMAFTFTLPVFAAEGDPQPEATDNSITVTNGIKDKTYDIYKIFDVTEANGSYAYTIQSNSKWVGFFTEVDDVAEAPADTYIVLEKIQGDSTKYNVKMTASGENLATETQTNPDNSAAVQLAKAALKYAKDNNITATATATADEDGTAIFTTLTNGYYLLDSSTGVLCSLNTLIPGSSNNITITEKNTEPQVDKVITEGASDDNSVTVGSTVKYQITVTAQKGAEKYIVKDNMTALKLNANSFVITKDGQTVADSNYTKTTTDNSFEITFTEQYSQSLNPNETVLIVYEAEVTDDAYTRDEATNSVTLGYGDNPESTTIVKTVDSSIYKFDLVKYRMDSDTKKVLSGAKFKLYKGTGNSKVEIPLVKVDENTYKVADSSTQSNKVDKIEAGNVCIQGLAKGSYSLVETDAPDGYNKLKDAYTFNLDGDNRATVNGDVYTDGGIGILNNAGSLLPSTGGIGTTIFYIIGGILVVGAAVLLVTKKRMSKEV